MKRADKNRQQKGFVKATPWWYIHGPDIGETKEDHYDEVERMELVALSTTSDSCIGNMSGIITGSCNQLTNDLLSEMPAAIRAMRFA